MTCSLLRINRSKAWLDSSILVCGYLHQLHVPVLLVLLHDEHAHVILLQTSEDEIKVKEGFGEFFDLR